MTTATEWSFSVPGEPVSKARARFTKYGSKTMAYTPAKTRTGEERIAWGFKAVAIGHAPMSDMAFGVRAIFNASTRQRRDIDNMLKLILDALNGVAWGDDLQVTEIQASKRLVLKEDAGTDITIYVVGELERRWVVCVGCGDKFETYPSWANREYCSSECRNAALVVRTSCEKCGKSFVGRHNHKRPQRYCSPECGYAARRVVVACDWCKSDFSQQTCHVRTINFCSPDCRDAHARTNPTKTPRGTCTICGAPVSKKQYQRCSACLRAGKNTVGSPAAPDFGFEDEGAADV